MSLAVALTIAGSDPSGGAGIQADLKTFHRLHVYGEAVITLLTVQNTRSVTRVELVAADLIEEQLRAVLTDIPPQAAKTGALGCRASVEKIAEIAAEFDFPLVVDPVMISKHGAALLDLEAQRAMREALIPRASLLTPNLFEAEVLAGFPVSDISGMKRAAERLVALGAKAVLVKGGHLSGDATDVLLSESGFLELPAARIATVHTHGTGCTYSAAIAAYLSQGRRLTDAVLEAKAYISRAIASAPGLGHGSGPLNHFA